MEFSEEDYNNAYIIDCYDFKFRQEFYNFCKKIIEERIKLFNKYSFYDFNERKESPIMMIRLSELIIIKPRLDFSSSYYDIFKKIMQKGTDFSDDISYYERYGIDLDYE